MDVVDPLYPQRKSQATDWYGYTVAIETGVRTPVAVLSINGHGMSGFSFLTTLLHFYITHALHITQVHLYENIIFFL